MWDLGRLRPRMYRSGCWVLLGLWFAIAPTLIGFHSARASLHPPDQASQSASRLDQGRQAYQAGRLVEAINHWQQAAQDYQATGNTANQALSLSYLAIAYQDLGQWDAAQTSIQQSLELLPASFVTSEIPETTARILAQVWNTQGSLQLTMGQPEAALASWQRAADIYAQVTDPQGQLGAEINQAQALQSLGLYQQARTRLDTIRDQLASTSDSVLKVRALETLGVTLQRVGAFADAATVLEESLAIATEINLNTSTLWLTLGHTQRGLSQPDQARHAYEQAATLAITPRQRIDAQLSQLKLLITTDSNAAQALLPDIQAQLSALPASRASVYAQVNFVQSVLQLSAAARTADTTDLKTTGLKTTDFVAAPKQAIPDQAAMAEILTVAVEHAQALADVRAESYAVGTWGQVYEQSRQWQPAERLTRQALTLVQGLPTADITYQWQWQLGRILCRGDLTCQAGSPNSHRADAIAAYSEAINQLSTLRADLVANAEVQFSFRKQVEPIYRELVTLLLTPNAADITQTDIPQAELQQARNTIESLQLAELDNFFQSACLDIQSQTIDQVDPTAAVLYPILLPDRVAVILALKDQPLRYYGTALTQDDIDSSLAQMRQSLSFAYPNQLRLEISQRLYDWLIRPAEPTLTEHAIQTLVLVPDGRLRTLPIAALYDGEKYLIETYSVAINSGLQLIEPQPLVPDQLALFLGGLTQSTQGFAPLPAAAIEMEQIAAQVPTQLFRDQDFTWSTLQANIKQANAPVVHLATHGQFSSNQEDTFILAWDGKVNAANLSETLQARQLRVDDPIELLVLSACQTASGDERAGLGLAGLALRSGARSTLASLWSINDRSTAELMVTFYNSFRQSGISKAEALRQAQLSILQQEDYQHPFFWAAFVMVGNWL